MTTRKRLKISTTVISFFLFVLSSSWHRGSAGGACINNFTFFFISDVNHEMDVGLHDWVSTPGTASTKGALCISSQLFFFFDEDFCLSFIITFLSPIGVTFPLFVLKKKGRKCINTYQTLLRVSISETFCNEIGASVSLVFVFSIFLSLFFFCSSTSSKYNLGLL